MTTNAAQGYVFLPGPTPLGTMLLTEAHDVSSLDDNSITRGDTVYVRDSSTGKYKVFTQLDARPSNSSGAIEAPLKTADAMLLMSRRFSNCPIPMQVRYYECDFPGKNPASWTKCLHVDHMEWSNKSFTNLTAQGTNNDDAVPTTTVNFNFALIEFLDKSQPGFYQHAGPTQTPYGVIYTGAPGCGDCAGLPTEGCEEIYGIWTSVLQSSNDGGATWANVATGVTLTTGGSLTFHAGRLVMSDGADIYYSDEPDGGASAWQQGSLPAGVTKIGRMASSSEGIFAIYNDTGILRSRDNAASWQIVAGEGVITAEDLRSISADGTAILAVGDNRAGVLSLESGDAGSWSLITLPGAATDDAFGVNVAQWSNRNGQAVKLYVAMDDGVDRVVHQSNDQGVSWTEKITFAGDTGTYITSIQSALHGSVIYVHNKSETWKSIGGGDSFFDISNTDVVSTTGAYLALCPHDPNEAFVISGTV